MNRHALLLFATCLSASNVQPPRVVFTKKASESDIISWNEFIGSFTGTDEDAASLDEFLSKSVIRPERALYVIVE